MNDAESYKSILQKCFPQLCINTFEPILDGWSSFVLEINGEYIFRFPRWPEIDAQYEKEILLLPELARVLPVSIPRFEFIWPGGPVYDRPIVGYRKIEGVPLLECGLDADRSKDMARQIGGALSCLHGFSVERAMQLGVPGGLSEWRQRYEDLYGQVHEQVLPLLDEKGRDRVSKLLQDFLASEAHFSFEPVLIHADLSEEHILCDPVRGNLVGIIDWGDACIGDPALDLTGLLFNCGADLASQTLAHYTGKVDETFWHRMKFYASVVPLYEILFGLMSHDDTHVKNGLELVARDMASH